MQPSSGSEENSSALVAGLTEEWSRPRDLGRLFEMVGLDRPQRMTEGRWDELHRALKPLGVGMCDLDGEILTRSGRRPAISERVRLRRVAAKAPRVHKKISEPAVAPEPAIEVVSPPVERDQVFVSYCRKDMKWLEKLRTHLAPMITQGLDLWEDNRIQPGQDWREEINKALARAKVAVLLVTPNFLASHFIRENELPPLLDAQGTELRIFWIAVRPSSYHHTGLDKFLCANNPAKTLNALTPAQQDQELVRISNLIFDAIKS